MDRVPLGYTRGRGVEQQVTACETRPKGSSPSPKEVKGKLTEESCTHLASVPSLVEAPRRASPELLPNPQLKTSTGSGGSQPQTSSCLPFIPCTVLCLIRLAAGEWIRQQIGEKACSHLCHPQPSPRSTWPPQRLSGCSPVKTNQSAASNSKPFLLLKRRVKQETFLLLLASTEQGRTCGKR